MEMASRAEGEGRSTRHAWCTAVGSYGSTCVRVRDRVRVRVRVRHGRRVIR